MPDISETLEAKSDQLNAVDIMGVEPVIRVRDVKVVSGDQPVHIYFDGDHGRPWKPSKGMRRVLAGAWGRMTEDWVGRYAQIYFESSVKYAGKEVGGIRIRALSDIDQRGLSFALRINQKQTEPYHVPLLQVKTQEYPADKFAKALPVMAEKMKNGEMTLQQVIAQCQKTGQLSNEQLKQMEEVAPVEIHEDDNDDEVM